MIFVTILNIVVCHVGITSAALAAFDPEFDPLPQYTFAYNVQDSLTGDLKSQQETRDGQVVKGW